MMTPFELELLPHEYELAYDPTLPISTACENLASTVEALRTQFLEHEAGIRHKLEAARDNFERHRTRAQRIEAGPRSTRIQYMAPPVKQPQFADALRGFRAWTATQRAIPSYLVIGLVAAFDSFEAELMRAAFKMQPKLLLASAKPLIWSDVEQLEDLNAVRGLVVEREIESLLRENHREQLKLLGRRFNAGALEEIDEAQSLVEITERRNIYAHQGGRITAFYMTTCGLDETTDFRPGEYLATESSYFNAACDDVVVAAVKLTQHVWRGIGGKNMLGAADRDLSQITYAHLLEGRWELARRLLRFACDLSKYSSEQHQLVFTINHAQAHKWLGNDQACLSILRSVDWDAKDQALQLSRAVLIDDFEEAGRVMYDVGSTRQVHQSAFDHWPIYRCFRETAIYRAVYEQLYGEAPHNLHEGQIDAIPA